MNDTAVSREAINFLNSSKDFLKVPTTVEVLNCYAGDPNHTQSFGYSSKKQAAICILNVKYLTRYQLPCKESACKEHIVSCSLMYVNTTVFYALCCLVEYWLTCALGGLGQTPGRLPPQPMSPPPLPIHIRRRGVGSMACRDAIRAEAARQAWTTSKAKCGRRNNTR